MSGRLWSTTSKPGEPSKHGLGLSKANVSDFPAVAPMPAPRRSLEPGGLRLKQEQQELQRVREPDVCQVGRFGESDCRVAAVECAAEAAVSGALRGHERMFA